MHVKCQRNHIRTKLCSDLQPIPCKLCHDEDEARKKLEEVRQEHLKLESEQKAKLKTMEIAAEAKRQRALIDLQKTYAIEDLQV
jgi:hypothetical protein